MDERRSWLNQVAIDPKVIRSVPERLMDHDFVLEAVRENGSVLRYVRAMFKSIDVCEAAVKRCGRMLKYVPRRMVTAAMCEEALFQDAANIAFIPSEKLTREMCLMALDKDPDAVERFAESLGKVTTLSQAATLITIKEALESRSDPTPSYDVLTM